MLLLLLSCFSCVRLCVTSWTAAHQSPPSLGFSRQEHWSGLPFPSPVHESEKWKWSRSVVSDSATLWTAAHQAPPSMGFSRQEYWSGVPSPLCYPYMFLFVIYVQYMNIRVIPMYMYICIYRLETQTGVDVAVLRWNFFLRKPQFWLLRPSTDGVKLTSILKLLSLSKVSLWCYL